MPIDIEANKRHGEALSDLYEALSEIGLHASDVVRELRRDGKHIKTLAELGLEEIYQLLADCERYRRRPS